jgi:hypothetical protein
MPELTYTDLIESAKVMIEGVHETECKSSYGSEVSEANVAHEIALAAFGNAMDHSDDTDTRLDFLSSLSHKLPEELVPELILQLIGRMQPVDGPLNKSFWLNVAETLGPDWAQALYHGAVFATKVA